MPGPGATSEPLPYIVGSEYRRPYRRPCCHACLALFSHASLLRHALFRPCTPLALLSRSVARFRWRCSCRPRVPTLVKMRSPCTEALSALGCLPMTSEVWQARAPV